MGRSAEAWALLTRERRRAPVFRNQAACVAPTEGCGWAPGRESERAAPKAARSSLVRLHPHPAQHIAESAKHGFGNLYNADVQV